MTYPSQTPEYRRVYYQRRKVEGVRRKPSRSAQEYSRDRHRYRREMLNIIKAEVGCLDCGGYFHPEILEFDHVRGDKVFTISSRVQGCIQKLQAEIDKCDIVCANCHRMRTITRRCDTMDTPSHSASVSAPAA